MGQTPVQLALKPDQGEIFCANFGSDSFSEIETGTNEVAGTYTIGSKPVFGVVSGDSSTLWVSNFGADSINLWSIDDGKVGGSVRTGHAPDTLAFSADEHLLLSADAHSGEVTCVAHRAHSRAVYDPAGRRLAQRHCGEGDAGQAVRQKICGWAALDYPLIAIELR